MKRITVIIGSPNNSASNTRKTVEYLFDCVRCDEKEYELNIVELSRLNIHRCAGCLDCFMRCELCARFDDDMSMIVDRMMESDMIIFACPVYAHNVPGIMKDFIDRISYALHIMKFAGKYGAIISVSGSNGNVFVNEYLSKIQMYFGMKVIGSASVKIVDGLVGNSDLISLASSIIDYLRGNINKEPNDYQELYFRTLKKIMMNQTEADNNEQQYWKANRLFEFDSFEELFTAKEA